ncbi:MAG: hypothetical protein IKC65_02985, partial [Lentisphaeria bacterium]|nr:hypothetical protein [Lentisphaeria bacterium]
MKIRQFCAAVQQRKGTAEYPNLLRSRSVLIGQQELEHQDTPLFLESKGERGAFVRRGTEVYGSVRSQPQPQTACSAQHQNNQLFLKEKGSARGKENFFSREKKLSFPL